MMRGINSDPRCVGSAGARFIIWLTEVQAFDIEGRNKEPTPVETAPKENTGTLLKRTGTLFGVVSKVLNANQNGEPNHIKMRREAEESDQTYRIAVRRLDRQRLGLEERIEEALKLLQRWESERLAAVKTGKKLYVVPPTFCWLMAMIFSPVLLQYQGTLNNLPKSLEATLERSATLIAAYQPDADLKALIERYRTGPFKPRPQVYESMFHEEPDVVFGIDLRKWYEVWNTGDDKRSPIPPVFTAMLSAMDQFYVRTSDDSDKRKAWIYEVPLSAVHHLRETLNAVEAGTGFSNELFANFDGPVITNALKLWFLELNPPIALYEGWDDFRKLYPSVGQAAVAEGQVTEQQRLENIGAALLRLPKVHLLVLDVLIQHLNG